MKVFIWGMGLIGASLGLKLREEGVHISGAVRSEKSREVLRALGFENIFTDQEKILTALADADILVLGLNLGEALAVLHTVLADPHLAQRLIICDICSTKAEICNFITAKFPAARFVGAHPMAGKEKQGPGAAEASLFQGSSVFLTPLAHQTTTPQSPALQQVEKMWQLAGARTALIDPAVHDHLMASVSHGLHLAACLIAKLSASASSTEISAAAGSYRDMTRITQSSGAMWSEIVASNRQPVAAWLRDLSRECAELATAIENNTAAIETLFSEAARARTKVMHT